MNNNESNGLIFDDNINENNQNIESSINHNQPLNNIQSYDNNVNIDYNTLYNNQNINNIEAKNNSINNDIDNTDNQKKQEQIITTPLENKEIDNNENIFNKGNLYFVIILFIILISIIIFVFPYIFQKIF